MKTVVSVEEYILKNEKWQDGLILLHEIITSTGLQESIKWGTPVYTYQGKNIIGIAAFKYHFALWFHQGIFLADSKKLLINASGNSKAFRQMRFKSVNNIDEEILETYVLEAIENHKAGKVIKPSKVKKIIIPAELKKAFNDDAAIKQKFNELPNRKQYEFTIYISSAKREETRYRRLDKCIPLILAGTGLNDQYQ